MSFLKALKKNKEVEKVEEKTSASKDNAPQRIAAPISVINVLRKPHLSEKAQNLHQINQYIFRVDSHANKPLIRKEIEHRYGVKVESVNLVAEKSKAKKFRNQMGRQPRFNKAIVALKSGYKIEIT